MQRRGATRHADGRPDVDAEVDVVHGATDGRGDAGSLERPEVGPGTAVSRRGCGGRCTAAASLGHGRAGVFPGRWRRCGRVSCMHGQSSIDGDLPGMLLARKRDAVRSIINCGVGTRETQGGG
jgi:hypothetical protein